MLRGLFLRSLIFLVMMVSNIIKLTKGTITQFQSNPLGAISFGISMSKYGLGMHKIIMMKQFIISALSNF
tara:strand:+ start:436 stop:645 length:210 start_codon:yes stop_codon:yes gene_type:complete